MNNFSDNDIKDAIIKEGSEGKGVQELDGANIYRNYFSKLVYEQRTNQKLCPQCQILGQVTALWIGLSVLSAGIMICINTIYTYVPTEFLMSRYLF